MKKELKEQLQDLFPDNDFDTLIQANEDEIEFIKQCHVGDMLIEQFEHGDERYSLWRILECNGGGVEVTYSGVRNGYVWETIYNQI